MNTYTYNSANRLKTFSRQGNNATYSYNGLGDRLQETINGQTTTFTMDLNTGLTQALSDETNNYVYGVGRIAQVNTGTEYFLGDALGSVRQLANDSGVITYAQKYDPYGVVTQTSGSAQTPYGYTGEYYSDYNELLYLRARYYTPYLNQFTQPDSIVPDPRIPADWNKYTYVRNNPINYTDPSGHCPEPLDESNPCWQLLLQIENQYSFIDLQSELTTVNYWTSEELLKVQSELERYSRASKIGLSTLYPEDVKLKRVRETEIVSGNVYVCGKTFRYFTSSRPIIMYDTWVEGCLIHELAHYLDWANLHLSKQFENYVGANTFLFWYNVGTESPPIYINGNPSNRSEDFAESLSEYVLLYTNYSGSDIGIVPGQKRWNFIESVLDTGKVPLSNGQSSCIPGYGVLSGFDYYTGVDL